eukprot:5924901-Pyramimonas_sp.AAC.1
MGRATRTIGSQGEMAAESGAHPPLSCRIVFLMGWFSRWFTIFVTRFLACWLFFWPTSEEVYFRRSLRSTADWQLRSSSCLRLRLRENLISGCCLEQEIGTMRYFVYSVRGFLRSAIGAGSPWRRLRRRS